MYRCLTLVLLSGCVVPDALLERYLDQDGDGERTTLVGGTDCRDDDLHVGAGAPELCGNGQDDDCDGEIDEDGVGSTTYYVDGDGDGFGSADEPVSACAPRPGLSLIVGDCDDNNRTDNPAAKEDCTDGRDNDCDRVIDEADYPPLWYADVDGDGFGDAGGSVIASCTPVADRVSDNTDCDDHAASAYPGATEIPYDGIDNACDGGDDFDIDGDGSRVDEDLAPFPILAVDYQSSGFPADCDDLNPHAYPGAIDAPYDGVDSNCDQKNDDDADGDGYGASWRGGDDCDDGDWFVHPDAPETYYDGVDDDCDPLNDDDADGDGHKVSWRGGDDCDDTSVYVWTHCDTCGDADGDGYWAGCDLDRPNGEDCNDSNVNVWISCASCGDFDSDGRFGGCDDYFRISKDCDDTNPYAWLACDTCVDNDGDSYRGYCDVNLGTPLDCNDALSNAWLTCATCTDADGDGVGVGACDAPTQDCDDSDPNSTLNCGRCVDEDGDFSYTGCDLYNTVLEDCDDADPERSPNLHDYLGDGLDQDCDGSDLVADDAHGVFVTPTGIDADWCGTKAYPCRTLAVATRQLTEGRRVLFLTEGVFASARVTGSVYGGFDSVSWTRGGAGETIVETVGEVGFEVIGRVVALDRVHARAVANWAGGIGVRMQGDAVSVADTQVEAKSTAGSCRALGAFGAIVRVAASKLAAECGGGATGADISPYLAFTRGSHVRITDTAAATRVTGPHGNRGFQVSASSLMASGVSVSAEGGTDCFGILAANDEQLAEAILVERSNVTVITERGDGEPIAISARGFSSSRVIQSFVSAAGGSHAVGVRLSAPNSGPNIVVNSFVIASSLVESEGFLVTPSNWGATSASLVHVTAIATGASRGVAVQSGSDVTMQLVNSALRASSVGATTWSSTELRCVLIDAPCALGSGSVCDAATSPEVAACDWFRCAGTTNTSVGDLGLDGTGTPPWRPDGGSPLVDAGVDPASWWSGINLDLDGTPRPLGLTYDIGAIESN